MLVDSKNPLQHFKVEIQLQRQQASEVKRYQSLAKVHKTIRENKNQSFQILKAKPQLLANKEVRKFISRLPKK